jgi:integrase
MTCKIVARKMTSELTVKLSNELLNQRELLDAAREYINQSKASKTVNAYKSDLADFRAWAEKQGADYLPATPEAVTLYITHLAKTGSKVSTIQRRLVAISQAHKADGYESPTHALVVRSTMQGIRRAHGIAKEGKSPILTEHVKAWVNDVLAKAPKPQSTVTARNKALVLLGFAGAFRRSELVGLNREDLEIVPQGLIVTLRCSKADQEGEGRKVGIPFGQIEPDGQPSPTCPVTAVLEWLEAACIDSGPLFRRIRRGGWMTSDRLECKTVYLIVKALADSIGLDPEKYGAHSLRAGHATQATLNGSTEADTMRQTGHKSESVFRGYVKIASVFQNNSAGRLGL